MTVAIKISDGYQTPAGGKCRTVASAEDDVVVQIDDHGLTRARVVKHVVGMAVAVKVRCRHKLPARKQLRTIGRAGNRQA